MKNFLIVLLFLTSLLSCGKKDLPISKDTLNIPIADEVLLELGNNGVIITNNGSIPALVEKAVEEVGNIQFPTFKKLVFLKPKQIYEDNDTEANVTYLYRIYNYEEKFNAYSKEVRHTILYEGRIGFDQVRWWLEYDKVCININQTQYTSKYEVILNGVKASTNTNCYTLPDSPDVLLVIVPYSEQEVPGIAYSTVINREEAISAPQNIKVVKRESSTTISWDKVTNATGYALRVIQEDKTSYDIKTDTTIINIDVKECVKVLLQSVKENKLSPPVLIDSCDDK